MKDREPRHKFIADLAGQRTIVSSSVHDALNDDRAVSGIDFFISLGLLREDSPDWYRSLDGSPMEDLQRLSDDLIWQLLIERSGFKFDARSREDLKIEGAADLSIQEHAGSISQSTMPGLGTSLPMFGIAALVGSDFDRYLTIESRRSSVKMPALVAAKALFRSNAKTPDIFLDRMRFLFPEAIDLKSTNAFSLIKNSGMFELDPVICPAQGLVKQIFETVGAELNGDFGARLIGQVS